ncbi:MFS transporter [Novosphingobium taihuense]|uniref:MFS family permease n=1 Tax=Novosphingobium taihuense TaxID=260085 RepID=A0A7W7AD60_9SPHN|nr:MFS transporter [Novosphingobium taihuense]MBB4614859.1 MFS family permease [Novosphingobium taihuense]TWH84700.1 putative MFS family arabinose efflux permease [Novosphingobium taihuense]
MAQSQTKAEFRAGWKVLVAGLVGVACGASPVPFNVIGFTIDPIHQETGWTTAQISLGITIFGIVAALMAPAFGWMADRFGVRRVAIGSTVAFAVSLAILGVIPSSSIGWYFGAWFLIGLVGIGSTPVTWSRATNMWFHKSRGLALGLLLMGTSICALTVPRLAVWMIGQWGWRGMYIGLSLLPLLIAAPLAFAWFREPRPEELPARDGEAAILTGVTVGGALRDRRFWTLWISIALVAVAYGGAHVHMPRIIGQHGLPPETAAGVMGMIGVAVMAGRIITGMLFDRFWAPLVCLPILLIPALACWLLTGTATSEPTILAAAFMLGFAAGAEADVIAFLASRYFGMAHYGKIYGLLYMPFAMLSGLSPAIYGAMRDASGSYDSVLQLAAALFATGSVLLLTLGRYPTFRSSETTA